jgi:hypothetical protein
MLLDVSLEEAIKMVGHDGISSDEDMLKQIFERYTKYHHYLFKVGQPPDDIVALVKHREPNGVREHWTISYYGQILDPACKKKLWPVLKWVKAR